MMSKRNSTTKLECYSFQSGLGLGLGCMRGGYVPAHAVLRALFHNSCTAITFCRGLIEAVLFHGRSDNLHD